MPSASSVGQLLAATLLSLGSTNPPTKVAWILIATPALTLPTAGLSRTQLQISDNYTILGEWSDMRRVAVRPEVSHLSLPPLPPPIRAPTPLTLAQATSDASPSLRPSSSLTLAQAIPASAQLRLRSICLERPNQFESRGR